MKNVMKKVFSLLLVGVVAVSMFGFITPNRVDAAETNAMEFLTIENATPEVLKYRIDFYSEKDPNLTRPLNDKAIIVTLCPDERKDVIIHPQADSVYLKTILLDESSPIGELYQEFVFTKPSSRPKVNTLLSSIVINSVRDMRRPFFKQEVCVSFENSFGYSWSATTREGM